MKAFAVAVLSLFVIAGLVGAVGAQSEGSKLPDVKVDKAPDIKPPDIKIEGKIETKSESPAASPRTDEGHGGRILGLNPTVAVLAGAAVFLVVVVAVVAMARRTS